jgi:hypothetical protein
MNKTHGIANDVQTEPMFADTNAIRVTRAFNTFYLMNIARRFCGFNIFNSNVYTFGKFWVGDCTQIALETCRKLNSHVLRLMSA